MSAADLWSLKHQTAAGDSDSAHQSSSLTSVGVPSHVHTWTRETADSVVYDTDRMLHDKASVTRLERPTNTLDDRLPGNDDNDKDDDTCYRTLADNMTAGAYQIKLDDRMTVLSC